MRKRAHQQVGVPAFSASLLLLSEQTALVLVAAGDEVTGAAPGLV